MSGEQDNNEEQDFTMADLAKMLFEQYMSMGMEEEIVKDFLCLRMHGGHAWGLAIVQVNGKKTSAIVAPTGEKNLRVVFIPVPEGTVIKDMYENDAVGKDYQLPLDPVLEKRQIN